jgi:hypothetical protein
MYGANAANAPNGPNAATPQCQNAANGVRSRRFGVVSRMRAIGSQFVAALAAGREALQDAATKST